MAKKKSFEVKKSRANNGTTVVGIPKHLGVAPDRLLLVGRAEKGKTYDPKKTIVLIEVDDLLGQAVE